MKRILLLSIITLLSLNTCLLATGGVVTTRPERKLAGDRLEVWFEMMLDSLTLKADQQLYVTPVVEGPGGISQALPTVLVNGRNMHYQHQRGIVRVPAEYAGNIYEVVRRDNGREQHLSYSASLPYQRWMMDSSAAVRVMVDSCGCGERYGSSLGPATPLDLNPVKFMKAAYMTPAVTELPVTIHEGRARVQFEVDRTVLHDQPYVCRNGQRLDNRAQLAVIDDSVRYALSNPNVEIASISICGYASPESPYLHNMELSTGRSRALAEYLADKYNLPRERSNYSAVAENWEEFRTIVEKSDEITPAQRQQLLELIDEPVYGPSDYDKKERTLKSDKRFAQLYRTLILPRWFPELRATTFAITTRLRPMSDTQLAEVLKSNPELMTLNQMMRVARLYPEGSAEFNAAINTALSRYGDDPVANLNAAVAALHDGDYTLAAKLLDKAGDTPEAENARGILATANGDFDTARTHFVNAGNLPEAMKNIQFLDW